MDTEVQKRSFKYKIGDRVKYQLYSSSSISGEGVIRQIPTTSAFDNPVNHYMMRYRVRHDGGTETKYVEVGVLEDEITECLTPLK
ncbi:MAG: hypothetical protein JWO15_3594 [Sphingomonadales bacterium]|nr:hypothetical protein [Sphingomonadales bacterium]